MSIKTENDRNKSHQMKIVLLFTGVQNSTTRRTEYKKLIKTIEYICELFFLALMKISIPAIMTSALIVTLINFIIFDLGDDAYYLPFPTMFVEDCER